MSKPRLTPQTGEARRRRKAPGQIRIRSSGLVEQRSLGMNGETATVHIAVCESRVKTAFLSACPCQWGRGRFCGEVQDGLRWRCWNGWRGSSGGSNSRYGDGYMTGSKSVMASKQFVADFDTVCARYGLTEAEKQEAKEAARRDLENAETCFAALAKEYA